MINTCKTDIVPPPQASTTTQSLSMQLNTQKQHRKGLFGQLLRFTLVGGLNTLVDLLILNGLLWFLPTTSSPILLVYNLLAYTLGALNSFLLNKYWTFGQKREISQGELIRFSLTTLCGLAWSSGILWLTSSMLHPLLLTPTLWANLSKVFAIVGTALISYLGMRLWVFMSKQTEATEH